MPVIETDTKQQIIEKLDKLPPDVLRGVLSDVEFVSMDAVSRRLLACPMDDEPLREDALALIEDALSEPRPGIPDEQIRQELGL